jgi:hypothetical protein
VEDICARRELLDALHFGISEGLVLHPTLADERRPPPTLEEAKSAAVSSH